MAHQPTEPPSATSIARCQKESLVKHLIALAFAPLLLAACQTQPQQATSGTPVLRSSLKPGEYTTLSMDMNIATANSAGQASVTPKGLRIAYLFSKAGVRSRIDYPAEMFSDGEPRITIVDPTQGSASTYFTRTLKPDQALSNGIDAGSMARMMAFFDPEKPFQKLSMDRFSTLARSVAFDQQEDGNSGSVFGRVENVGNMKHSQRLYFDATVGAVTRAEDKTSDAVKTTVTTSNISYVPHPSEPNTIVPSQIVGVSVIENTTPQANLVMPTASETMPQNGTYTLKPGEYRKQSFIAPLGEGSVDINKMTINQTINYTNLSSNGLRPEFFYIGSEK
jgi:hypothetical protein